MDVTTMQLIDADWIKDRNSFVPKHELHTVEEFLQILDEAPTIDAVPVVRCRECIHWNHGTNDAESWEYCTLLKHDIDGDMFCSLGERKDVEPRCKTCKARCVHAGHETSVHGKCLVGYVPITNADVVRAMSDKDLAKFIERSDCPPHDGTCDNDNITCSKCWLQWLQIPAGGDGNG